MKLNLKYLSVVLLGGTLVFSSCTKHPDSPGYEYVPDMYRSQAVEAYVDYGLVGDDERGEVANRLKNTLSARTPVEGTIPFYSSKEKAQLNMPYPYALGQKLEASEKWTLPESYLNDVDGNLKEGKRLYNIFCQHCHGLKGQGDGGVVEVGGFNPPGPFNSVYKDRSMGSIYHTITHGTGGAMGAHASQISKEDRWRVVMYVNSIQNGEFIATAAEPDTTTIDTGNLVEVGGALFTKMGCTACHQLDTKTVGPALLEIAKAYEGNTEGLASFLKGTGEAIVDPAMFAVMQGQLAMTQSLGDDDLNALVEYILNSK